ncbi:MAG: phosphate-starvation-inducible E, partial [Gammaproteobacteria bacterium]
MSDGRTFSSRVVYAIEHVGLWIVLLATLAAVAQEVWVILEAMRVTITDLLLLFIYLEIISMIGIYFSSHQLPIRFPLYIAIVALARHIILGMEQMDMWKLLAEASSILIIAVAILIIRIGHVRYP